MNDLLQQIKLKPVETSEESATYHKIRKVDIFEVNHPKTEYDDNHPDEKKPQNHPHILVYKNEVIGAVRLDELGNKTIGIRMFGIKSKYQKKGVGTQAIKLIEEYARRKNCNKLVLNANKNSIGFYGKKGFVKNFWEGDSKTGSIPMGKNIDT